MLVLLVKGTGACLPPAFLVACLVAGRWRWLADRKALVAVGVSLGLPALWYTFQQFWTGNVARWAGVGTPGSWGIASLVALAGPGLLTLAALGAWVGARRRDPLVTACSALLLAVVFTSFFMRAMNEQRHFLLVLPAILLLSLVVVLRLWAWRRVAAGAAVAAGLLLFPWTRYVQYPEGFSALAPGLRQPGRMLVSAASGHDEGPFIVVASLRERRPGSVIVRASKVLAQSDWSGGRYRLLVSDRAGVAFILDRYGLDTVIVAGLSPAPAGPPHHQLLLETLAGHPSWKLCGTSGDISMFCRTQPPQVPREPLQIDLRRRIGRLVSEP